MTRTFAKRTFTMPLLLRSMGAALLYMPIRWIALVRPAIPRGLREEVFLGVTSVNDCRWCTWLHSGFALMHGVKLDELQSVLGSGTAGTVDEREATAILFAQHFADTLRHPTPEARLFACQTVHALSATGDHGLDSLHLLHKPIRQLR